MKSGPLLIIPLLLAVGLGVLGWREWKRASPPPILLSDGSWLEFRAVTVGTNCTYHYGPPWQRLAARIPGKLGQKLGGKAIIRAGNDSRTHAVFWFVRRGGKALTNVTTRMNVSPLGELLQTGRLVKPGQFTSVVGPAPPPWLQVNLKDEQGEGEPGFGKFSTADLPNGEMAMFWSARAVPRHSPSLKFYLYGYGQGPGVSRVGEMRLPNPLYRKEP